MREQRLGAAGVAAQHGADARVELVELERLDEVVVGAGVEPGDAVAARVARGEHDHRRRVAARAQRRAAPRARRRGRRRPGAARQAEVEQDQVEALARQRAVGGGGVAHPVDGVAFEAQRPLQALADHAVVFDEEKAHSRRG